MAPGESEKATGVVDSLGEVGDSSQAELHLYKAEESGQDGIDK